MQMAALLARSVVIHVGWNRRNGKELPKEQAFEYAAMTVTVVIQAIYTKLVYTVSTQRNTGR